MKVLITGGAGYIGSILTRSLLEAGHEVTVFDKLYFGDQSVADVRPHPKYRLILGDIRDRAALERAMAGQEAVIHLAAIVGDPACAADADLAVSVNFNATVMVAELSKRAKVRRFVFASTCSVYGANAETVDETSELNPLSLYAQTRLYGEHSIRSLAEPGFRPVVLRLGTVYGLSPRMRFDLVINYLTQKLYREKAITIFGGEQWRPLIHVSDAARAFQIALEAPADVVEGEVFNVGANGHNFQLKDLIPIFQRVQPDASVSRLGQMDDKRSYRVNFDKIARVLSFQPRFTPEAGIRQILEALSSRALTDVDHVRYYNHKVVSHAAK